MRTNVDRLLRLVARGEKDAYDEYLIYLLRGYLPDWPVLFKYWLAEPCRTCKGSRHVDDPFDMSMCDSCSGTGETSVNDVIGLKLIWCTSTQHPKYSYPVSLKNLQAMRLIWSYIASSDYSARVERSNRLETMSMKDPTRRLSYAVMRFAGHHLSYNASTHTMFTPHTLLNEIRISIATAVNMGWIKELGPESYVIPDNNHQPKIRDLEALKRTNKHAR